MRRPILSIVVVLLVTCVAWVSSQPMAAAAPPSPPALERWPDKDPGPPFTISVSANRAGPQSTFKVSGLVRNDGDQTYEAIGVLATFYSEDGFQYGPVDTRCPCTLFAPGESCPFFVQAAMRNPVAFRLHPEGRPTGRESAPVALRPPPTDLYDRLEVSLIVSAMPWKHANRRHGPRSPD